MMIIRKSTYQWLGGGGDESDRNIKSTERSLKTSLKSIKIHPWGVSSYFNIVRSDRNQWLPWDFCFWSSCMDLPIFKDISEKIENDQIRDAFGMDETSQPSCRRICGHSLQQNNEFYKFCGTKMKIYSNEGILNCQLLHNSKPYNFLKIHPFLQYFKTTNHYTPTVK